MIALMFVVLACNGNTRNESTSDYQSAKGDSAYALTEEGSSDSLAAAKFYANARFRNVSVKKFAAHQFAIQGEAQIFEANFGWAVEDGHQELKNGFEMTDAGAPEWGKFKFTIEVEKQRPNSTLTLILFESSPKDGARQHELPILLD